MFKINMNDKVKVKLTDVGRKILLQKYKIELGLDYYEIKEDEEGYYHTQVWDLMNIFGKYLYAGCEMPFEINIIVY